MSWKDDSSEKGQTGLKCLMSHWNAVPWVCHVVGTKGNLATSLIPQNYTTSFQQLYEDHVSLSQSLPFQEVIHAVRDNTEVPDLHLISLCY